MDDVVAVAAVGTYPRVLADVNGDRMADIIGFGERGVHVSLATGGGNFAEPSFLPIGLANGAGGWSSKNLLPRRLGDINEDGAADIVAFGRNGVYASLSNGFHLV